MIEKQLLHHSVSLKDLLAVSEAEIAWWTVWCILLITLPLSMLQWLRQESISRFLHSYSLHLPDRCVGWIDLCQGVSFCEGDQVCKPGARAPETNIPARKYLIDNDNAYDVLNRSDENIFTSVVSKKPIINYTALSICSYNDKSDHQSVTRDVTW